jgi:hypothetical protein
MSLMLLATTLFDRLRARARRWLPDSQPAALRPERPREQRKRLRHDVVSRGGCPSEIETIGGNCPDQIDQQIADLSRWLDARRVTS